MAGDWIKWSKGLTRKMEILQISARLHVSPTQAAGTLMQLMEWLDENVSLFDDDGNAHVTLGPLQSSSLDSMLGLTGFMEALAEVGWVKLQNDVLIFVHAGRHNGQTAKSRAVTNRRVARHRESINADGVTPVTREALQNALPEKRREEYNPPNPPKHGGGIDPEVIPIRQSYPESLAASAQFVSCWENEWMPYLLQRGRGHPPPVMTTEKHLAICMRLGPTKAIAALKSAMEKNWAAPDENVKQAIAIQSSRPWEEAPEGWKAYWRETYPPEDFPDAPRYEDGDWSAVRSDHRKQIYDGMRRARRIA